MLVYRKKTYCHYSYCLMGNQQKIDTIRSHIDTIDSTILKLLHKRLGYAKEIGQLKKASSRSIEDREREEKILQRLLSENSQLLSDKTVETVFTAIIAACRKSQ